MELIEREGFLALLQKQFEDIVSGEGHCIFITGEAGIGKTSLVKEFCKKKKEECTIYRGACDGLFTPRPLAPLYDILWQVNKERWPVTPSNEERSALFANFFQELSTKKERLIMVFEDIHWADEGTLDFVKFFARRISHLPCLFIVTFRDDEIHSRYPLRQVLSQLPPDSFTKIKVTPLSKEAVSTMAVEKGYSGEDVYSISGGNPFYVNEILASYSPGVPDNIKDSILSVYERQDDGTKHAWQICSVVPEGLEIERFAKIKSSWNEAMDHCFAMNVIIVQNDKVVFKHELYRRTIEESLSPFMRIALNKMILELFLKSFEEKGDIERIVHYAKNSNDNTIVVQYAPVAARKAACAGAHLEASKLFLTAIEYANGNNRDLLIEFYEAYAYECYLTNQIKEAIIFQGKALNLWQEKNDIEQEGNSMRLLSRLWWIEGNRDNAEKFGKKAIDILQTQPTSKAKAMAFSNMSQLKMFSEETFECIEWGNIAITMAREISDDEILCHALGNVGTAHWRVQPLEETGKKLLLESLNIALKKSFHDHAARAYTSIIYNSIEFKQYEVANQFLQNGINYCEERDLDSSKNYILSLKARILLEAGNWDEAVSITKNLLTIPGQPAIVKIGALVTLASIEIRKGNPDALLHLQEAKTLALVTKEHQRIIPVMIAILEYEWLTSKKIIAEEELNACIDLVQKIDNTSQNSKFCFWLYKARKKEMNIQELYKPYMFLKEGKAVLAATFWKMTGCPFELAFALSEGNEEDKRNALPLFQKLGADAVYEKIKMEMRAKGIKKIPRGLRQSTKTNPAQLTNRELDVLNLLQKAIQNKEIAETLFISSKTVDHHISSILFKLDTTSRAKAVSEAVRLGILK